MYPVEPVSKIGAAAIAEAIDLVGWYEGVSGSCNMSIGSSRLDLRGIDRTRGMTGMPSMRKR